MIGDAHVWFRLQAVSACADQIPTCWEVTVLNRGERTVFRFVKGLGLDLNGDGKPNLVRARLGEWTTAPVEFYQGSVTFSQDAQGRTLIREVSLDGEMGNSH